MRIQFDIDGEWEARFLEQIPSEKARHIKAEEALHEWITRQEGRDRRAMLQREKRLKDIIRPLVVDIIEEVKNERVDKC